MKLVEIKKNAAVFIISSLLSLLAGEIVVRLYLFGSNGLSYSKMTSNNSKRWSESIQLSKDSTIRYELRPDMNKEYKFKSFQTNSEGQNDKDYSFEKPARTIRVAVIGDSFTMGWGVERKEIYHEIMEEKLNDQADSLKYEFINFGVGGYNFQNYIGVLETKALKYSPDFILIGFCAFNDFRSPKEARRTVSKMMNKNRNGFYSSFLFKLARAQYRLLRKNEPKPKAEKRNDDYVQFAFSHINGFSEKHNIPVALAYLSTIHLKGDTTRLRVKQLADINNLKFIDASALFENTNVRDYTLNFLDPHPTKEAHQLFATSILDSPIFDSK